MSDNNDSPKCLFDGFKREKNYLICKYHLEAFDSLKKTYNSWKEAYDNLKWIQYLEMIIQKSQEDTAFQVGEWVIEIAQYLLKHKKPIDWNFKA